MDTKKSTISNIPGGMPLTLLAEDIAGAIPKSGGASQNNHILMSRRSARSPWGLRHFIYRCLSATSGGKLDPACHRLLRKRLEKIIADLRARRIEPSPGTSGSAHPGCRRWGTHLLECTFQVGGREPGVGGGNPARTRA